MEYLDSLTAFSKKYRKYLTFESFKSFESDALGVLSNKFSKLPLRMLAGNNNEHSQNNIYILILSD